MSELEKVKLLHDTLVHRGRHEEARSVLRDIRELLHDHFPMSLQRALSRYEMAYSDLAATAAKVQTAALELTRGGGGTGDPTSRQALNAARKARIDDDLRKVFEKHLPALNAPQPPPQPARRRVGVWRESASDEYSQRTIVEIREEYGA